MLCLHGIRLREYVAGLQPGTIYYYYYNNKYIQIKIIVINYLNLIMCMECQFAYCYDYGLVFRKILAWRLSSSPDTASCIVASEEVISMYGIPEIFNSDQSRQFTSEDYTGVLKTHEIRISMSGIMSLDG